MSANGPLSLSEDMIYKADNKSVTLEALEKLLEVQREIALADYKALPKLRWVLVEAHPYYELRYARFRANRILSGNQKVIKTLSFETITKILKSQCYPLEDYWLPSSPDASISMTPAIRISKFDLKAMIRLTAPPNQGSSSQSSFDNEDLNEIFGNGMVQRVFLSQFNHQDQSHYDDGQPGFTRQGLFNFKF